MEGVQDIWVRLKNNRTHKGKIGSFIIKYLRIFTSKISCPLPEISGVICKFLSRKFDDIGPSSKGFQ
jgi:hypothetical protein